MKITVRTTITVLGILLAFTVFAQETRIIHPQLEERIRFLKDSFEIPGLSVSVIRDQQVIHKNSYGFSNLEHHIEMTDSSVFRVWSISKQLCAVVVLHLTEQGKIGLEQPLSTYLESLPDSWNRITVRQLLNHTGGIMDYLNDYPEGEKLIGMPYEVVMDSTSVLKFSPGEEWSYSNTGYWVLTKIVESVSGMNYQVYLREKYLKPAGMERTRKMDYGAIIPGRVSGYRVIDGIPYNSTRYLDEGFVADGDGELLSTLEDLTAWTLRLMDGQFIRPSTLQLAWEPNTLSDGSPVDASYLIFYDENPTYGLGWFIDEINSRKVVWTPGAGRGFSTTVFTVPDLGLSMVVLANTRRFLVADRIARDLFTTLTNPY